MEVAQIIAQEYKTVAVDSLTPHPSDPRKGVVETIEASIAINGFYGAIVVQKSTNTILAGEHRWKAAKAQGLEVVPVIMVEVSDETARRIVVSDNRTQDLADYDYSKLSQLLQQISEDPNELAGTGYTKADLQVLLAAATTPEGLPNNQEELYQGMPTFQVDGTIFRQILVNFASEEDVIAFQALVEQDFGSAAKKIWFPKKVNYDSINHTAE